MPSCTTFVFFAALVASCFAQNFTINTPASVSVCLPISLAWTGGQAPYFLSVNPANQPDAPPLVNLGQISDTSVIWVANLGVGTYAFLNLRDNTGTLAQSGIFAILPGSNTTCVGQPPLVTAPNGGSISNGSTNGGSTGSNTTSINGANSTVHSSSTGSAGAPRVTNTHKSSGAMILRAPTLLDVLFAMVILPLIQ